ncbi:MAG: RNA methyltransferase [Dysgonamonadaceae bacterium]|jgi:TrmH family RNA methyltransferase|nr:RNA methyltransferase [Dysgonamonadaceae bacterium]
MALSKNKIKYIQSLKDKKHRLEYGVFVAEGTKLVFDLLATCKCQFIAALPEIIAKYPKIIAEEVIIADENELKKATFLKTPPQIIGVFYQPDFDISTTNFDKKLSLVLDGIQDPGNIGTIVRLADWFGMEDVICSPDTVDIYNPKTVQATMGAIARVKVHYTNLTDFLQKHNHLPIYGTFLEGKNIYNESLSENGFIVMGNEGNGIRSETEKAINRKLFIPSFPSERETSESLNVGVATGIICGEFRRRYDFNPSPTANPPH